MRGRLEAAAWALVAVQLVHGFIPADTESEGSTGLVAGLALLIAATVGAFGARNGRPWGAAVVGWTGLVVAVGFVLYHALPWKSPFTNPYVGEGVGAAAWLGVGAAVAVGVWAAYEGLLVDPSSRSTWNGTTNARPEPSADTS